MVLTRDTYTEKSTTGRLFVDGAFECYTLEDPVRKEKIPHETAIPAGTYEVVVTMSPRFQKRLPRLLDVPNFTGILIHPGNTPENTWGCILPGVSRGPDRVNESRKAFDRLFAKIEGALRVGEVVSIAIEEA